MGLVFKVSKELGFEHKESFYQKALAKEFEDNGIIFKEQLRCKLKYKEKELGIYIFNFLVFDKIVVEIKQKKVILSRDIDQLYKYLKAMNWKLGIIITFTKEGAKFKRVVNLK